MLVAKKVFLSSLVMAAVPTVLFFCLYGIIYFGAKSDQTDYSMDVMGTWSGVQYYQGGQKTVCAKGHPVTVIITSDEIAIDAGDFPLDSAAYSWRGRSLVFMWEGTETAAAVSFDNQGYLKLTIHSRDLTLTLRQEQTEDDFDAD